ncbi:MAG: hypothetical protein ACI8WB_003537 [Phenylobacterium sp.]|jgi:uncharacterized protein (DUF885 family)
MNFKKSLIALTLATAIVGCSSQTGQSGTSTANSATNSATNTATNTSTSASAQVVNKIINDYFLENLQLNPINGTFIGHSELNDQFRAPISDAGNTEMLALEQRYLNKISQINPSTLTGQALLSYEIFKLDREVAIEGFQFPFHLLPLDQMRGTHNQFAGLGSGKSGQPFNTVKDYDNFVSRADGFVLWLDSAIASMRQGITQGITLPKVLAKKVLPQLQSHVVDNVEDSIFWMPITNMPKEITGSDKKRITRDYQNMVMNKLVPVYQRMANFIEKDYIPNARETIGYADLPNGHKWYEYAIKTHTTLDLSAKEIHQIGLDEVSRILGEMKTVKQTVKFDGDMAAFFKHLETDDKFYTSSAEELIAGYNRIKKQINERVPMLFDIKPKADYVVKPVEAYRAASAAGASYQSPAPDGSRPGIFYINTHNLRAQPTFIMETLSIHEAAPGHHFQLALQQEIEGLSDYRKFGGYTAYAEGWALYAESLGKEMGLFTDPYMWYGRLVDEQLRAMRLVVDTGMHAMGWSREKAIEYMKANSSMAESDITAEVERYISWPGQALSYKLGQRKIRELRDYAEKTLGSKFDVRQFHTQLLIDGSLAMPTLESKIKRWVSSQM